MKWLGILLVLFGGSTAAACELSLVAPATSALKNPVQVRTSLADDALIASFSVASPSMNAKKVLGPGEHPYQFDVVELFVTFSGADFPTLNSKCRRTIRRFRSKSSAQESITKASISG